MVTMNLRTRMSDTNCNITKGQNTDQNIDTNGRNILKVLSDSKEDTDTNSPNNKELALPASKVSNSPDETPLDNPHQETRVYGTVKVHNQILDLWLYEAETRKIYVSVPKLSDTDIHRWINPASAKPSWQDLDPYSSLKEIVSDDDNNTQSDTAMQLYHMREMKTQKHNWSSSLKKERDKLYRPL